jgi:hypothetical protein
MALAIALIVSMSILHSFRPHPLAEQMGFEPSPVISDIQAT